ncbi:MAG: PAS domain S-box protein [Thermodesulfobacteriota bacterium]
MEETLVCEELAQRVRNFAKSSYHRLDSEKQLELLLLAIHQSSEGIAVVDMDGHIEYLNSAFAEMHGYSAEELVGKNLLIFHNSRQFPFVEAANKQLRETGGFKGEVWHVRRNGTEFPTLMHNSLVRDDAGKPVGMIGTLRDITDIKEAQEALRKINAELENLIEKRTKELEIKSQHLEEVNTALKVLLKKRERDKEKTEENIAANISGLIIPSLQLLENSSLSRSQKQLVGIIKTNLAELTKSFSLRLTSRYFALTPTEIQVANLIKQGHKTKEIAAILNSSYKTIETHREKVRRKFGITNQRVNLRVFLLNFK